MAYAVLIIIVCIAFVLAISSKKKLLYFFFLLYPILPEYLAFNIVDSLPLITGSRILLIIAALACLIWNGGKISFRKLRFAGIKYSLIMLIIAKSILYIAHMGSSSALKDYFSFWLEDVFFLIVMSNLISQKDEWEKCLEAMLIGAAISFFFGIFESLTRINIATTLMDTGARSDLLMSEYERHNHLRCTFTFGHAICLGVYCVCILPLAIYTLTVSRSPYMPCVFILLCIGCLLMTISRAPILIAVVMLVLYICSLSKREKKKVYSIFCILAFVAGIVVLVVPRIRNMVGDSIMATLNALGTRFKLEGSDWNANAIGSRLSQFTVIPQVVERGLFMGLGAENYDQMNLTITTAAGSFKAVSLDNQYLSWFVSYGLVGFIGNTGWFAALAVILRKRMIRCSVSNGKMNALYYSMMGCMVCYLSVNQLTTNRVFNSLIVLICSGLYIFSNKSVTVSGKECCES